MKISIASPTLVLDPYTGTHGLYAAVMPDEQSIQYLIALASSFGIETKADKLHVTLMYSPDEYPKRAPMVNPNKVFEGRINEVVWWPGHDNKGYLNAKLISTDLQAEHRRLLSLGCKHTFSPFVPHVTLWKGIKKDIQLSNMMARLNANIAAEQPPINLSDETIADIKPD